MTNENRCGSKGRWPKKKLSHPADEISKFQEMGGGGRGRGEGYALYRNKRNPMGGSAKYISHRSCSRQSLSYRDRSIFDGANTAVRPSIYNIKRGQNLTRLCYGLSFMFLNHSILTVERAIERKEKEGRRIFWWIQATVDIWACDFFFSFKRNS